MKIFGKDKPTISFRVVTSRDRYTSTYTIEEGPTYYTSEIDVDSAIIDLTETARTIPKTAYGTLTDSATLYFDKSATFPRYRLEGSNYKRCIKADKADFIVVGKTISVPVSRRRFQFFESDNNIYFTYMSVNAQQIEHLFKSKGIVVKCIYEGWVRKYSPKNQILLTKLTKPLITDETLSKALDTNCELLTEDSAKQIIAMLKSSDESTIDLGIKMLTACNLSATPFSIKVCLMSSNKWLHSNAKNSVAAESMFSTLQFEPRWASYGFPYNLNHIVSDRYSEEDIKLAKSLMKYTLTDYYMQYNERLINLYSNLGFEVNVEIK